jgi:hypothetical protein
MSLRTKTTSITILIVLLFGLCLSLIKNYPLIFTELVFTIAGVFGISWLWMTIYNILKSKS